MMTENERGQDLIRVDGNLSKGENLIDRDDRSFQTSVGVTGVNDERESPMKGRS